MSVRGALLTGRLGCVALLLVATAACSDRGSDSTSAGSPWVVHALEGPMLDGTPRLLAADGRVIVLGATKRGDVGSGFGLASWVVTETGELLGPSELPSRVRINLWKVVRDRTGFLALGSGHEIEHTMLWRSLDGLNWEQLEQHGLEPGAEMRSLEVLPVDGVVAAGQVRDGQPRLSGRGVAAVWWSADGTSFERVLLPGAEAAKAGDATLSMHGEEFIVRARNDETREELLWRSHDGQRWEAIENDPSHAPDAPLWSMRHGDGLIGLDWRASRAGAYAPVMSESLDGGQTWKEIVQDKGSPLSDISGGRTQDAQLDSGGGLLWLTSSRRWFPIVDDESAEVCYSDRDRCMDEPQEDVFASRDGSEWRVLDLGVLGPHGDWSRDFADGAMGPVILLSGPDAPTGTVASVAVWSSEQDLWAQLDEPSPRIPVAAAMPLARDCDMLDLGVTYRFPLYVHCGLGRLGTFNGVGWVSEDGPYAAVPDGALASELEQFLLGHIEQVAPDRIEYSLPTGELLAVYTPTTEEPPRCA